MRNKKVNQKKEGKRGRYRNESNKDGPEKER